MIGTPCEVPLPKKIKEKDMDRLAGLFIQRVEGLRLGHRPNLTRLPQNCSLNFAHRAGNGRKSDFAPPLF